MQDGISVLIGGAFLLTPGILTDLTGFSLLFPPTRRWIQKRVRKRLERGIHDGTIRVVTTGAGGLWSRGGGGTDGEAGPARRPSDPYDGRNPADGIEVGDEGRPG
jgi:UPF0716 protein FxsA